MKNPWRKDRDDDSELPAELKGKTPEQIALELKEAAVKLATAESNITTLRTEAETQKSEFTKVKEQIALLENAARAAKSGNNGNQDDPITSDTLLLDPDKTIQSAIDKRMGPLANIAMQNAATTARILAQQQLDANDSVNGTRDGRLFRYWAAEINEMVKQSRPEQLAVPQAWISVYYVIKGQHADELADPEKAKKYSALEPARGNGQPNNEPAPSGDKLTEQEIEIAKKMGVSPESYLKRKKSMVMATA